METCILVGSPLFRETDTLFFGQCLLWENFVFILYLISFAFRAIVLPHTRLLYILTLPTPHPYYFNILITPLQFTNYHPNIQKLTASPLSTRSHLGSLLYLISHSKTKSQNNHTDMMMNHHLIIAILSIVIAVLVILLILTSFCWLRTRKRSGLSWV